MTDDSWFRPLDVALVHMAEEAGFGVAVYRGADRHGVREWLFSRYGGADLGGWSEVLVFSALSVEDRVQVMVSAGVTSGIGASQTSMRGADLSEWVRPDSVLDHLETPMRLALQQNELLVEARKSPQRLFEIARNGEAPPPDPGGIGGGPPSGPPPTEPVSDSRVDREVPNAGLGELEGGQAFWA